MNQLLCLSGANAPPAKFMPESSSNSKPEIMFGQPSFAEIFKMQTTQDSAPQTTFQPMGVQQADHQEHGDHVGRDQMRSGDADRYHHRYDEQIEEKAVRQASGDDPASSAVAAANAASVQTPPTKEEPKQVNQGNINFVAGGENHQNQAVNDVATVEIDRQLDKKSDRIIKRSMLMDIKAAQDDIGRLEKSSILPFISKEMDSKRSHATGQIETKGMDHQNLKSRSGTRDNVLTALQQKQEALSQPADKEGKMVKPTVEFSKTVSDQAVRFGEKSQTVSTKKEVKADLEIKAAGDVQLKSEPVSTLKSEVTEHLGSTPNRMAESHSLNPAEQIIKNVEVMVKGEQTSMRLQLQPESLGKIELRLLQTDHGMVVALIPDESSTSALLEKQLADLRSALTNSGIQLSELWVGQHEQAEQQAWWSKKPHFGKHHRDGVWDEELPSLVVERRVSYSVSGLDYLV